MPKSLTLDSLVTLILVIWMSISNLEPAIRCHLSALAFKKFSENQSNILCTPFSSFSKIQIISGGQLYRVVLSAKLACSESRDYNYQH